MNSKKQSQIAKGSLWTVTLFYLLVAFEFFYMAGPFAAYFYSLYKPGLSFIDRFPTISWISGFFLPHLVESTRSNLINSVKTAGTIIALAGFIIFLVCAAQVYYAKIFKKGMVKRGLYRFIRHPQYTAFAICSFGLLLLWPRYLVLIFYVTLLFAYYLLAKTEEKECIHKYGEEYQEYMRSTYRFFPIRIPVNFPINLSTAINVLMITGVYLITVFLVLKCAIAIKHSSIDYLYTKSENNAIYVSINKLNDDQISRLIKSAQSDSLIRGLYEVGSNDIKKHINYILPADMYISEIPMNMQDGAPCHVYTNDFKISVYKIIFCKARTKDIRPIINSHDILFNTISLDPLAEVWVDNNSGKVIKSYLLTSTSARYRNIPEPIF